MNGERKLLVGIDLCDDMTQISCFDRKIYEPIPIGRDKGEEREYEIPMVLAVHLDNGQWFFGGEACEEREGCLRIDNILAKVEADDQFDIDGYTFKSREVLKKFMVKELSLLKEYYPNDTILKLVVTVPDKTERIAAAVTAICESLGISKERLVIQNHKQSYMYYAVSQAKELWMNNVGMFEYGSSGLKYSQITIDRRTLPYIVGVEQKDLSDVLPYSALETSPDIRYSFLNVANTVLHKQMVTTIYVTGVGFEGKWAAEALKELCNGRRVFRGQNLFTKGACYAARELAGDGKLTEFLFMDEDMIASDISVRTYHNAELHEVVLAKAGTMWSDIDASIDVIPDDEDEIQITDHNVLKHETKAHMLSLSGFVGRANKMTRFTIRIRFADRHTCIVTLKDNGFGEFCPSSNRIWERYINIQ